MTLIEFTEVLGNLGEFLGSLAVFATLIYLAVQVRQSRALLERNEKIALSQVHQARTDSRLSLLYAHMPPEIPEKVAEYMLDSSERPALPEDLTSRESLALRQIMASTILLIDNALYQAELGLLDEEVLAAAQARIAEHYGSWEKLDVIVTHRIEEMYRRGIEDLTELHGA